MQSQKLDQETMQAVIENTRNNFRNQAEYWETRYQDMRELLLEMVALQSGIICELRTDIELLEVDVAKGQSER